MSDQDDQLNSNGRRLLAELTAYHTSKGHKYAQHEKAHVVGVGRTLTSAYEQLRNAAEYTEEHLLLQKAIGRYFRRLFLVHDRKEVASCGAELVVELTLAGYLENDSIPIVDVDKISKLALEYFDGFTKLEKKHTLPADTISTWIIDVLSVRVGRIFNDYTKDIVFAEFAYSTMIERYDPQMLFAEKDVSNYPVLLYVSIQRALLHADEALIRATLVERYDQSPRSLEQYTSLNKQIDELIKSDELKKIYNLVNRDGAPYRILRQMLNEQNYQKALSSKSNFKSSYLQQIETEYRRADSRINKAIIKSVIFLFITKVLIGLAIEIPYDQFVHGRILWLPLIINLLFPPLFMLILRYTLVLPSSANTAALMDKATGLFYEKPKTTELKRRLREGGSKTVFQVAYTIFGILIVCLVIAGLLALSFSWLHILIFFVFVSTASFLGFRLSRIVRELEVVEADQSTVSTIRDFFYMPFVVLGQWMTNTYSQFNVIGTILDMVIELPMKTILRLIRQWSSFINERKDEL